jgi:hypothetical protein
MRSGDNWQQQGCYPAAGSFARRDRRRVASHRTTPATLETEHPADDPGRTGVAEIEDGYFVCERCGKVKPVDAACGCGGKGDGEPLVPEGWDPELTRGGRPRLDIVARPEED